MRTIGIGLYAEGPTDQRYLGPVLRRATEIAIREATDESVDVQEILPLDPPRGEKRLAERVAAATKAAAGAIDLIFVHQDGGGDWEKALEDRIAPTRAAVEAAVEALSGRLIPVVPVRETEAWALVDGDALRAAFGTRINDAELGLPGRPHEVEKILDPKRALDDAYRRAVRVRRPAAGAAGLLEVIGREVRLECLRGVPSFARLEGDLKAAVKRLFPGGPPIPDSRQRGTRKRSPPTGTSR